MEIVTELNNIYEDYHFLHILIVLCLLDKSFQSWPKNGCKN